jgi:hypothetical protein
MNNKSTERIKTDAMQPPSKLILDNQTDLPMVDFLSIAQKIVASGRISNDERQYCDLTVCVVDDQEYHIASELNENSDKLTLTKPTNGNPTI